MDKRKSNPGRPSEYGKAKKYSHFIRLTEEGEQAYEILGGASFFERAARGEVSASEIKLALKSLADSLRD